VTSFHPLLKIFLDIVVLLTDTHTCCLTGLIFSARGPLVARQSNLPSPKTTVTIATEMLIINSD